MTTKVESILDLTDAEYQEWLRNAGKSIGGSQVGTLMGFNKWSNPELIWESILELTQPQTDNKHLRRGRIMEPVVVGEYEFVTKRITTVYPKKQHPTLPFLHGSPDRLIIGWDDEAKLDENTSNTLGVLEAKCPAKFQWAAMRKEGIPATYYVQAQHYMNVFELEWGSYAALNAEEWMLGWCDFPRNDHVIEAIEQTCRTFWDEFVIPRQRPSPHRLPVQVDIPQIEMRLWTP